MTKNISPFIKNNFPIIIILLGVILRLAWVFLFPTYPETDFMWYHVKATELSEGKGLLNGIYPYYTGTEGSPTAFRPIGYPGTLASVYLIFGSKFIVGKLLNVFLSALIMTLMYKIALNKLNKKIACIAVTLYALSPLAIVYNSILGSELLFCAVLVLATYTFFIMRNIYFTGFLIGYITLIRPIGMFLPLIFIIYILIDKDLLTKEKLKKILILGTLTCIVVTPWLVRNYITFDKFVFSTNGGYVFYVNNNPHATGSWSDPYKYPNSPFLKYKYEDGSGFDEIGQNDEGTKLAIQWIRENPSSFLKLGVKRLANSYFLKTDDIEWAFTIDLNTWDEFKKTLAVMVEKALYPPVYLIIFAYIGFTIFTLIKTRKIDFHTYILLIFLYFNAMMFVLEGNSRYVFPLHPLYSIGVAYIIFHGHIMIKNRWKNKIG